MFDGRDPNFAGSLKMAGHVVQHGVVRFSSAGGPDEVERVALYNSSESLPGVVHSRFGASAEAVRTGRVAREVVRGTQPCVPGDIREGHGRVVIEIGHGWNVWKGM